MNLGVAASTNNWAGFGFTYNGNGSTSNKFGIAFYGGPLGFSLDALGNVNVLASLVIGSHISTAQSATSPTLVTSGTITTAAIGVSRVAPAAAVTAIVLQAGTVAGQQVTVVNESTTLSSITFDIAANSNVADGATSPIVGLTSRDFVWDSVAGLWYRAA
jgi:hypothetical protein